MLFPRTDPLVLGIRTKKSLTWFREHLTTKVYSEHYTENAHFHEDRTWGHKYKLKSKKSDLTKNALPPKRGRDHNKKAKRLMALFSRDAQDSNEREE